MVQVLRVYLFFLMPFDRCLLFAFLNLAYNQNRSLTNFANFHSVGYSTIQKKMKFVCICLYLVIWEAIYETFVNFLRSFCNIFCITSKHEGCIFICATRTYLFFIIRNKSHIKILNKSEPIIEPWCTPDIIFPHEL